MTYHAHADTSTLAAIGGLQNGVWRFQVRRGDDVVLDFVRTAQYAEMLAQAMNLCR